MTNLLTKLLISRGRDPAEYQVVIDAYKNETERCAPWFRDTVLDVFKHENTYFVLHQFERWSEWEGTAHWGLYVFSNKWAYPAQGEYHHRNWNTMPKSELNKIQKAEKTEKGWEVTLAGPHVPPKTVVFSICE